MLVGAVDEALDPLVESVQRADETEDKGLRVAVRYCLAFRQWLAGRFRENLSVVEQGLDLAQADLNLGTDRIGFSPSLGFRFMKGTALCLLGHLREGEAELHRVIELARASHQVLGCELTGDAASAMTHARQAVDYAERIGSGRARISAYGNLGIANVLNGAWNDAAELLERAVVLGRERRLPTLEGRLLTAVQRCISA